MLLMYEACTKQLVSPPSNFGPNNYLAFRGLINFKQGHIIQYSSSACRIMKVLDFFPQNITQNQLHIYFVTYRQYWLDKLSSDQS